MVDKGANKETIDLLNCQVGCGREKGRGTHDAASAIPIRTSHELCAVQKIIFVSDLIVDFLPQYN